MYAEFLDELLHIQPFKKPEPLEPWRSFPVDSFIVPVVLVRHFASTEEIDYINQFEGDQVDFLRSSIRMLGLQRPLEMTVDTLGKLTLRDGHHRLLAFMSMGEEKVPVFFTKSTKIKKFCRPLHEELPNLLRMLGVS